MKYLYFLAAACTLFFLGRYSAPEKIKIEKQTVTIAAESKSNDRSRDKEKIETAIKRPDGTIITRIKYVDRIQDLKNSTKTSESIASEKKDITTRSGVEVSLIVGTPLVWAPTMSYGVRISDPILGPFHLTGDLTIENSAPKGRAFLEFRF